MSLPITERQASEMSGTDLFYTVVRGGDGEYGDPYYVRLASLMSFILGRETAGYVTGPAGSTNNAVARWSGDDGDQLRNSVVIIDDAGAVSGVTTMSLSQYVNLTEIPTPGNPDANDGRMYAKDDGGLTKPYWLDSAGTESLMLGAGVTGVISAAVIADHTLVRGDGGARGVQDSGITVDDNDDVIVPGIVEMYVLSLDDTNQSHYLQVLWDEDEAGANREFNIRVGGADRIMTLEGDAIISQDYSDDATPTFGGLNLNGDADMNDNDVVNLRDILPYDNELNIQFPSPNAATAYVRGTFNTTWTANPVALSALDADLKAVWHLERTSTGASEEDSKGSNDFDASNVSNGPGVHYNGGQWVKAGTQDMSQTPGADLLPADGFGFSFWINMVSLPPVNDYYQILQSGGSAAGTNNIMIKYYNIGGVPKIQFEIRESDGTQIAIAQNYTLTIGTWFHVYALADGANIELYINAIQIGASTAYDGTMRQNASDFILGSEDSSAQWLDAKMDEGYWWKGTNVPTAADLYNTGTGAFYGSRSVASLDVQDYLYLANLGLQLADTDDSHYLTVQWNEDDVNSRVLSWVLGGASREITLSGNPTLADWFNQSVKTTAAPTFDDLLLYDTNASHTVTLHWNEDEAGANRALNFTLGGADRALTIDADGVVSEWNTAFGWGDHAGLYSLITHLHDTQTIEPDGIDSDGGAFPFDTTGIVTFNSTVVASNGAIHMGVDDTQMAWLTLYGHATGSVNGGRIYLYTAFDHHGVVNNYYVQVSNDLFQIGDNAGGVRLELSTLGHFDFKAGNIATTGTIKGDDLYLYDTNASHTVMLHWNEDEAAANRTLNFTLGGADRTITLEGDAIISQDYSVDGAVQFGTLGVGIARTDGTLHVHTATAGAVVANAGYDDLVVENSASSGISVLSPDALYGGLLFTSPSTTGSYGAFIGYQYSGGVLYIATSGQATDTIQFYSGNEVLAMTIGAAGNVGIGVNPSAIARIRVDAPDAQSAIYRAIFGYTLSDATNNYGVYGQAAGGGGTNNYGVFGRAANAGTLNHHFRSQDGDFCAGGVWQDSSHPSNKREIRDLETGEAVSMYDLLDGIEVKAYYHIAEIPIVGYDEENKIFDEGSGEMEPAPIYDDPENAPLRYGLLANDETLPDFLLDKDRQGMSAGRVAIYDLVCHQAAKKRIEAIEAEVDRLRILVEGN